MRSIIFGIIMHLLCAASGKRTRAVFAPFMILSLVSTVFLAPLVLDVERVKAEDGIIYIRADGSVDPQTAPISTLDNVRYLLTDDINGSIVVEKNDIAIDGEGHMLQGTGSAGGFYGADLNNVTIRNVLITNFSYGIEMDLCSDSLITGVTATHNSKGIWFYHPGGHTEISSNIVADNRDGIWMDRTGARPCLIAHNIIENNTRGGIVAEPMESIYAIGNSIAGNYYGAVLLLEGGSFTLTENNVTNNYIAMYCAVFTPLLVYHNNFIDNSIQTSISGTWSTWNEAYPSGGNYWSDYRGNDTCSGPYQNEPGSDGIGDEPYVIRREHPAYREDRDVYPLMVQWSPTTSIDTNVTRGGKAYSVRVISNVTVSDFEGTPGTIKVKLSAETGAVGYVKIVQPFGLNGSDIKVFLNNTKLSFPSIDPPRSISTDGICYFIYSVVTFQSSYELEVVFPIKGDLNIGGTVDIYDALILAKSFGSDQISQNWNESADMNSDGIIDIYDAITLASNFGNRWN